MSRHFGSFDVKKLELDSSKRRSVLVIDVARLRQKSCQDCASQSIAASYAGTDDCHLAGARRQSDCQKRGYRADDAAADVGSEAFPGTSQMDREDQRNVVAPEAELANRQHSRHEDTKLDHRQRFGLQSSANPVEQGRHKDQCWESGRLAEGFDG